MDIKLRHYPDGLPGSKAFSWPYTEVVKPIKAGYNLLVKTHYMPSMTTESIDTLICDFKRGYTHGGMTEVHIPMVIEAYTLFKTERLLGIKHASH
ncbi:hypothetical protein VPHK479_0107 [Vibrio phage K479]